MRKLLKGLPIVLLFLANAVSAQQIKGIVQNEKGKGLKKATVSLLQAKDSSIAKLTATDNDGAFVFDMVQSGKYLIKTSFVGYQPAFTSVFTFTNNTINLPVISLDKTTGDLAGVVVSSKKPILEVKADKMILNVEGTINAVGNDALELLRRSPGVMIDKDDNISLAGKNGVRIYIDGKPSPLSGADLANFLKGLQSSQIASIEIITNPSAKYDAAGNAGIINLRLKKNQIFGTNGSANLGYVQGVYPKFDGGLNLNYRNKKINLYGSYTYSNKKNQFDMSSTKSQLDTFFSQHNKMIIKNETNNYKVGLDIFMSNKSTLGAVVSGNLNTMNFFTSGPMYFTYEPNNTLVKILDASNENKRTQNNFNANLNYRYDVKGGKSLGIDADYSNFKINSNQYQPNIYYMADGTTEINRAIYNMIAPTDIDLGSLKADYEQDFKGGKLGFGAKAAIVNTDNDFQRYNVYGSGKVLDTLKSNRFEYNENINALYVNYNKQLKKGVMFQVGLRAENTHSKGTSTGFKETGSGMVPYDSSFKRTYTDLFPSAAVTFNKNPMKQLTISYSRRIDRPAYQDLNPFEFKLNEYAYMKGNTELKPQYTNSLDFTYVYKFRLTTKLTLSHVSDIFAQIPDTIEKTKGFLTKKNLATQNLVALNVSYPFQYKKYSFFANVNANYSHYKANLGGGDRNVNQEVFSTVFYMQNSYDFGKGWKGELTGLYLSPSVWQGLIRSKAMGSVDIGLQKTIFKGNGNIKFAVSDIFKTMKWGGTTDFTGVYASFNGHGELPQYKLNLSFRFGNSKVKAARKHESGLEKERKRAEEKDQQGGIGQ